MLRPSVQCSCSVLEGQVLEHVLRLVKIEILSVCATEYQMLEHFSSLLIKIGSKVYNSIVAVEIFEIS